MDNGTMVIATLDPAAHPENHDDAVQAAQRIAEAGAPRSPFNSVMPRS